MSASSSSNDPGGRSGNEAARGAEPSRVAAQQLAGLCQGDGAMVDVDGLLDVLQRTAAAQGFDTIELGRCGRWPLLALRRLQPGAPRVYLSAGVHGDEPAGPLAIAALLQAGELARSIEWRICPLLNPTGLAAGTRHTGCGSDLNRDYSRCRSREARWHADWLREEPLPQVFLSLHEDYEAGGLYLYEINTSSAPSWAPELLAAGAQVLPIETALVIDDHAVKAPGWILHPPDPDEPEGWPEAIYLARLGPHVSYTFETPSAQELSRRIECHRQLVRRAGELITLSR